MVDRPYPQWPNLDTAGAVAGRWSPITLPVQTPQPAAPHRSLENFPQWQDWRWLLLGTGGCCATGSLAVAALLWLIDLPPQADCDNAALSSDRARLSCAQAAVATGSEADIRAALELLGQWGEGHPLHQEILPLAEAWSQTALQLAKQQVRDSDLDGAIALIRPIPRFSSSYAQGQALLANWQQDWQQGEALRSQVQAALQRKDWATATQTIAALSQLKNDHWRLTQPQRLRRRLQQEQVAQRQLAQAKTRAAPGGIEPLSDAIRIASQIQPDTYTWQESQPFLDRWSDLLLTVGLQQWYALQLDQALGLGQTVRLNPRRAQVAQELIWLVQARQLARTSLGTWQPRPRQTLQLYRAMLLANQIPPNSRFYPQAQSSLLTWREHLQDLGQLQVAQTLGQFQHREALRLAISQARAVPAERPRRIQAQTLVAHWRQEIDRIQARPQLQQAHHLAEAGTPASFRQAIAQARQIAPDHPLHPEAQDWIDRWRDRIETLEDAPILEQARELATAGRLVQAIATAGDIAAGRALHDDAQAEIDRWQAALQAQRRQTRRRLRPSPPLPTSPAAPAPLEVPRETPQWSEAQSPPAQSRPNAPSPVETSPPAQPTPNAGLVEAPLAPQKPEQSPARPPASSEPMAVPLSAKDEVDLEAEVAAP